MKKIIQLIVVLVFSMVAIKTPVHAYSYGDPNEEKVAEVHKEMLIKLNQSPPDYESAQAVFNTVKEEIDMHMGKEPGEVVISHLESQEKEATITAMEKILVLNISRRLDNVDKAFEEYDSSKKLLAKAFATYKALSPTVEKVSPETDEQLKNDFELTLNGLGNPGLFGVGEKESNYDQFIESKTAILTSLQELFNMQSVDVGHFTEEDFEETGSYKEEGWTDFSSLKNWLPLVLLVGAVLAVIVYVRKKR